MKELEALVRQALARGYCTERNGKKILDADLIEDMAVEVEKLGLVRKPTVEEIAEKAVEAIEGHIITMDGEQIELAKQAIIAKLEEGR